LFLWCGWLIFEFKSYKLKLCLKENLSLGYSFDASSQTCLIEEKIRTSSYNETCTFDADCDTNKSLTCSNRKCVCSNGNKKFVNLI